MMTNRLATRGRMASWMLAVVVWSLVGSLGWAQPDSQRPRGGGGPRFSLAELATQKSVEEELKLSSEEVGRLKSLAEEGQAARREMRDLSEEDRRKKRQEMAETTEKKVAEIVKPEQLKRLKQIYLQVLGTQIGPVAPAFRLPQVVSGLSLTEEQKEKIATISHDTETSMSGLRQSTNPIEAMKEYLKLREIAQEKIVAVLTSEQQDKWKEMTGEPFKGEVDFPGRGPGAGGRNRN
jgi:eukaryotic-like serine/threonine-protein kinase